MAIIPWDPFRDMDRFFDESFSLIPMTKLGLNLAVDVYEEGKNIVAEMQLPGIDPEKVNISVEDGYLVVSGSREEEKEKKEKHYYSKEIRRGSFERAVRLPSAVVADKAEATYENGVLKVTVPKKEEQKGKVHVKVAKK
ncbi:MAG: hypothetical protein A3C80_02955 [Candidatus Ryanbacteria bacterium RIFCSPHIGHO2_02_FULL_45_43]|uniref:SHSP domain-containing protein n=1 Tax=Candidatus Ryanbacteria bacterium RIFCSPHIGHO2_01_45_13 TaxID=1802112 RepID=A0A1G2FVU4_9BACT|nr:MAG: hypothetical protein A2W41_01045 [Candidatus Ryanbacteria bacterium RIFCSPHIGHO2_01_45_13]OGZ41774.1 MAG: hypothetical protein A2718_00470 [Candidatus Ryanbacteria bacterium RIFCSPHIGHO2_01_FULL_44_130]OGZ48069.1 MAG: hypothetical protein A3C80_02955 [Candidatus Ryanbacteria bacterium RIFCSPHIGHO2_02_FULL_45_43]OGZ50202.1 MAG: hypothetical protein A3E55_01575 [Candidatus Ryanbacteria bacterium RIFCSPHIGHO2_12_FULL_44_20]OGZ51076.1 MAG: hypothetical protein A3A17_02390 [Candidatus Ryanba